MYALTTSEDGTHGLIKSEDGDTWTYHKRRWDACTYHKRRLRCMHLPRVKIRTHGLNKSGDGTIERREFCFLYTINFRANFQSSAGSPLIHPNFLLKYLQKFYAFEVHQSPFSKALQWMSLLRHSHNSFQNLRSYFFLPLNACQPSSLVWLSDYRFLVNLWQQVVG